MHFPPSSCIMVFCFEEVRKKKKKGSLLVSFPSMVNISRGEKKVKVAAKNVSGSRQESLHEELIHPRKNHQVQKKTSTWVQN